MTSGFYARLREIRHDDDALAACIDRVVKQLETLSIILNVILACLFWSSVLVWIFEYGFPGNIDFAESINLIIPVVNIAQHLPAIL